MNNATPDMRHAKARDAAEALQAGQEMTQEQLQAALANALQRIATLEDDWAELGRMFRWLHERIGTADE